MAIVFPTTGYTNGPGGNPHGFLLLCHNIINSPNNNTTDTILKSGKEKAGAIFIITRVISLHSSNCQITLQFEVNCLLYTLVQCLRIFNLDRRRSTLSHKHSQLSSGNTQVFLHGIHNMPLK